MMYILGVICSIPAFIKTRLVQGLMASGPESFSSRGSLGISSSERIKAGSGDHGHRPQTPGLRQAAWLPQRVFETQALLHSRGAGTGNESKARLVSRALSTSGQKPCQDQQRGSWQNFCQAPSTLWSPKVCVSSELWILKMTS